MAVHLDGVIAVKEPSNSPPVSRGFDPPLNSPSTVPVVPFPMTKTPVTSYTFSVNAAAPRRGRAAAALEISWKNKVISDGTLGGGVGKAL